MRRPQPNRLPQPRAERSADARYMHPWVRWDAPPHRAGPPFPAHVSPLWPLHPGGGPCPASRNFTGIGGQSDPVTRWAAEQRDMIGSMDGPGCRARARGFVVALAGEVVWANACTSTEPNDEQGGDRPPSPPTAEAVFERLLNEHQQVDDADWMIDRTMHTPSSSPSTGPTSRSVASRRAPLC